MAAGRRTLEAQALSIEKALAKRQVKGMVMRGVVTPQHVRYEVALNAFVPPDALPMSPVAVSGLADEIALALGKSDVSVRNNGATLQVETARETIDPVRLLPLCNRLYHVPALTAVLGVDEAGAPLLLRLSAPDVSHVLVAGITGAGKTALLRTILTSLVMHNRQSQTQLILIDPKGRGFAPLQRLPHLLGDLVRTPEEALACLKWVVDEMARRERTHEYEPALVIAVDELADLVQTGGERIGRLLTRIAERGREVGMHLLLATQKPTAAYIGGELKAAIPVRIVGVVGSREEARYASGINESGAETLEGRGDFLLVSQGEVVRFQAAWVGRHDLEAVEMRLAEGGALPLRFVDVAPAQPPLPISAERKHRGPHIRGFRYLWRRVLGLPA